MLLFFMCYAKKYKGEKQYSLKKLKKTCVMLKIEGRERR